MLQVKCSTCGTEFLTRPSRISGSKTGLFFCGSKCRDSYKDKRARCGKKRNGEEVSCCQCGKKIWQPKSKLLRQSRHHCSRVCYLKSKREDPRKRRLLECLFCKKKFYEISYRDGKVGRFCSSECYGKWRTANLSGENSPNWKGGYSIDYGGGGWHFQRVNARKRDNFTCQDCGVTEQSWGYNLDVHHLVPFDMFDDPKEAHDLSNLITLCRKCHSKRHALMKD